MTRRILAGLLFAVACSSNDSPAVRGGNLTLTLTTAGANDGAVVLVVSGGPVTAVKAAGGYQIASNTDARGTHILVIGNVAPGALATIAVPDVSIATSYVVIVEQVAERTSFDLLDPLRYRATVGPTQ